MGQKARAFSAVLALGLMQSPRMSLAGNNSGGSAYLSWSEEGQVTHLSAVPGVRFPLFLRLQNSPDIRELAVAVRWTPNSIFGPCFWISPDNGTNQDCGWTSDQPPGGPFNGDSTYTWTITFPWSADKTCVVFWIEGGHCDSVPAFFCLQSVKTLDSNGHLDVLASSSVATLVDADSTDCGLELTAVFPSEITVGVPTALSLVGHDFDPEMAVSLQSHSQTTLAASVQVLDGESAIATVTIPEALTEPFDVIVEGVDGQVAVLPDVLVASEASTCSTAVITGVHVGPDGHVTYSQDSTGYKVTMGQPVAPSGAAIGCGARSRTEPVVTARFTVDIDVRCGGLLTFLYDIVDYSPRYTFYAMEAILETPAGTVPLLEEKWNRNNCWGTVRESGRRLSWRILDEWAGQQLQLKFFLDEGPSGQAVDEQIQVFITQLRISSCKVPSLTPLSNDSQTQWQEQNPNTPDTQDLTPTTQQRLACVQTAVTAAGGQLIIDSAYRNAEYQRHIREVWDKWQALKHDTSEECHELRDAVDNEMNSIHHLAVRPQVPSPHTAGAALDMKATGISEAAFHAIADVCQFYRPAPTWDKQHYIIKP